MDDVVIGKLNNEVRLLSAINLVQLEQTLTSFGGECDFGSPTEEVAMLHCKIDGLDFSMSLLDPNSVLISDVETDGIHIRMSALFAGKKGIGPVKHLEICNDWNCRFPTGRATVDGDILRFDTLICVNGVTLDSLMTQMARWLDACIEFQNYLVDAFGGESSA